MRLEDHRRAARRGEHQAGMAEGAEGGGEPPVADDTTARLTELEEIVEEGLETFIVVGTALGEIRNSRLYRERGYETFEAYCRARWGWDRRNANRYIEAAEIARNMGSIDPNPGSHVPGVQNVGQARAIAPLYREDEEEAAELMRELRAEHGEGLTAATIREAVAGIAQPTVHEPLVDDVYSEEIVEEVEEADAGDGLEKGPTRAGPETAFFRDSLPVEPGLLAEALEGGRSVAMACDVFADGKKRQLKEAKSFLEAAVRAAGTKQRDAHLLVLCSPDRARREAAERALKRPLGRRRPQTPRDPIVTALPLLAPGLARKSSGGYIDHLTGTGGIIVSRDEDRLLLERGNLQLSIPVAEEVVSGLTEPIAVTDLEQYKSVAVEGETVRFAIEEGKLTIRSVSRRFDLSGHRVDDMPSYPLADEADNRVDYKAGELAQAIDRVLPYTSKDDDRPVLTAVCFEKRNGGTRLVATDSYRLICDDTLRTSSPPGGSVLLTAGDLKILSRVLGRAEPDARVSFTCTGAHVVIFGELTDGTAYEIACRPLDGEFPDYQRLLPDENDLARFGLRASQALEAVKIAAALVDKALPGPVALRIEFVTNSAAEISITAEGASFSETVAAQRPEGTTVRAAGLNPLFLAQALKSNPDEEMIWLGINQNDNTSRPTLKPIMIGEDVLMMPMHCPSKTED